LSEYGLEFYLQTTTAWIQIGWLGGPAWIHKGFTPYFCLLLMTKFTTNTLKQVNFPPIEMCILHTVINPACPWTSQTTARCSRCATLSFGVNTLQTMQVFTLGVVVSPRFERHCNNTVVICAWVHLHTLSVRRNKLMRLTSDAAIALERH